MSDVNEIDEDFPAEKIGEWIQVDAETHVMVVELLDYNGATLACEDQEATHTRCIMQVETDQGSVALCETHVPIVLVMRWIEEEREDEPITE